MSVHRHGGWGISPIYWSAVVALKPTLTVLTKRDWHGTEHLRATYPPNDGIVVVANHLSWFDPLALAHVLWDNGRTPRILAKDVLFQTPGLSLIMNGADQIPVARGSADAAEAVAAAVQAVEEGETVVLYPEGTMTRDPDLWPMTGKTGAARIALTADAPVIPIAQWGPQNVMRPYTKEFRALPRKTMQMNVGAPVDLDDLRGKPLDRAVLAEATERIIDRITELLAELRGEQAPPERLDWSSQRAARSGAKTKEDR